MHSAVMMSPLCTWATAGKSGLKMPRRTVLLEKKEGGRGKSLGLRILWLGDQGLTRYAFYLQ